MFHGIKTDYQIKDHIDNTLLEKKSKGVVTKFRPYVEVRPAVVAEEKFGVPEHLPGFPSICYVKPENEKALVDKIIQGFFEMEEPE